MRPIDADELKIQFSDMFNKKYEKWINEIIDKAPTLDVIPNKEGHEMYNKGYASGYERGKEERSQADIPRLTCFDCKFAAVCEDSGYVFCVKRKSKVRVNDIPCFSYYKPRYTN